MSESLRPGEQILPVGYRHPSWDQIEPAASEGCRTPTSTRPHEHEIELSKAISAKRTADALDRLVGILGPEKGTDITTLIYYLTTAIESRNS